MRSGVLSTPCINLLKDPSMLWTSDYNSPGRVVLKQDLLYRPIIIMMAPRYNLRRRRESSVSDFVSGGFGVLGDEAPAAAARDSLFFVMMV